MAEPGQHDHPEPVVDEATVATLEVLDDGTLDWGRVTKTTFLAHHVLRYVYPGPIRALRHRLMVVPPASLGDQRRIVHRVEVTGAKARTAEHIDRFGNLVVEAHADQVEAEIRFEAWAVAERCAGCPPASLPAGRAADLGLASPSPRTEPDPALRAAAAELAAAGPGGLDLAERAADWTSRAFTYGHGTTDVATTAAQALAGGRGVCQDYAHVLLSILRTAGLAARYVSGHLLGEGGTHAWVEVLVPDPARPGLLAAVGLDPTNARRAGHGYLTIAVGRDYGDVSPTSGTFEADYPGRLSSSRRVGVTAVEYGLSRG